MGLVDRLPPGARRRARRRRPRQGLPLRRRLRAQRRRRPRAVVERGQHPADAGEHPRSAATSPSEMKINVWFRQGGYLFLVAHEDEQERLEQSVTLQNECGLAHPDAHAGGGAEDRPRARHEGVVAASYNPDDGVVFPWPFVWGYAHGAREARRRDRARFTDVIGFERHGRADHARASPTARRGRHPHRARQRRRRVVAADRALLGVELPNHPHRHEICSTEPLKPWLGPLVADAPSGPLLLPVDARRDRGRHRPSTSPSRRSTWAPRSLPGGSTPRAAARSCPRLRRA